MKKKNKKLIYVVTAVAALAISGVSYTVVSSKPAQAYSWYHSKPYEVNTNFHY